MKSKLSVGDSVTFWLMKSNYKKLGDYIRLVDERNTDGSVTRLLGVSIEKKFIESIANTIGTDMSIYKIVRKGQFAYGPVTSRNGDKVSIALLEEEKCIISSSYSVFEIINTKELLPEYLNLWFKRPEFDRYARFHSHGSAREIFDWEEMCNVELPVPEIEEQRKIVEAYNTIERRIALKRKINDNLESQANTIFRKYIADTTTKSSIYDILSVVNGAAFSSEYFNTDKIGLPLVRIRDLKSCVPEVWTNEILTKAEYIRSGDILIGMDGEFVPYIWYGAKSLLNQRVCKVIPKQGIHPFFLYATLKPILADIERTQGGTTVIHLGKKDFDKMVCFNIDNEKHYDFFYIIEPIYSLIIANNQEILSLSEAKKSILSYLSR